MSQSTTPWPASSRAATDRLLGDLRAGGLRPRAWSRFFRDASLRSFRQAVDRPEALLEVTALHVGMTAFSRRHGGPGLVWIGASWMLAVTHLGLLEQRRRLGLADLLTLARANLPALAPNAQIAFAAAAVITDVLDGPLARRMGTATPFGRTADSLADAAFWSWFVMRRESSPLVRTVVLGSSLAPIAVVGVVSVAGGRMVDPPRRRWLRPAATVQGLLLLRVVAAQARERRGPAAY